MGVNLGCVVSHTCLQFASCLHGASRKVGLPHSPVFGMERSFGEKAAQAEKPVGCGKEGLSPFTSAGWGQKRVEEKVRGLETKGLKFIPD